MILFFFFNDTAPTEIYTLSLHDALPICIVGGHRPPLQLTWTHLKEKSNGAKAGSTKPAGAFRRSEEHTSELQSRLHLVCRLLLEKKKTLLHFFFGYLYSSRLSLTGLLSA